MTIDLFDAGEVARAVGVLYRPGDVFEVRIIDGFERRNGRAFTWSGWFDNAGDVVEQLRRLAGWSACYVTANPVDPLLLHKRANRLEIAGRGETTNDAQIPRRAWLLADFDPVIWGTAARPIKGIPATDAEHEAALQRAQVASAALQAEGWPAPVAGDSGNGAHLIWPVDLPADSDLPQRFLHALAARFGDDEGDDARGWNRAATVGVDLSVFNASRIWKLYGTTTCKGSGIGDRPWRQARLLDEAGGGELDPGLLEAWILANEPAAPSAPASSASSSSYSRDPGEAFDPIPLLRAAGLEPLDGHRRADGVTFHELGACPCDRKTERKAYVSIGPTGAIGMGCKHASCAYAEARGNRGDNWKAFRAAHDPDYGKPKDPPVDRVARAVDFAASWGGASVDDFAPARPASSSATTATPAPAARTSAQDRRQARVEANGGRARIIATDDSRDVRDRVLEALAGADGVYLSQGRLATSSGDRMVHLQGGALDSVAVNACRFVKVTKSKTTGDWIDNPADLPVRVRGMLERLDALPAPMLEQFRVVDQVTSTPFFTGAGEFVAQAGYSRSARTLLLHPPQVNPYCEPDAGDALAYLRDLVSDFPFQGPAEIANWIGAALVPMVRPMIDGPVPMLLVEGNIPGLGKSMLASAIRILYGLPSEAGALPKDERMVATLIPSILRDAAPIHVFDDITHTVSSATLNRLLTCRTYSDRILGVTETASYIVRQLFIMTLNNASISADMIRRVFRARLRFDGPGKPEERRGFRHGDFLEHVTRNRADILSRLAQLVVNWIDNGMPIPDSLPTMGSFEGFCRVVGGIMYAAGERDWLGNLSEAKEALAGDDDWPPFVEAWYRKFSRTAQKPWALLTLANELGLLDSVRGVGNDAAQTHRLRYHLRNRKDNVIGGYRIVEAKDTQAQRVYSLEPVRDQQLPLH